MRNRIRLPFLTQEKIIEIFHNHFLSSDDLWIFGSRVDPSLRGGDIDLYIETDLTAAREVVQHKVSFLVDLKSHLGDQKIDVVVRFRKDSFHLPIYDVAQQEGIKLT